MIVALLPPLCASCRFWWDVARRRSAGRVDRFCCDAFPDGIPERYITGEELHLVETEGDSGMVWTPARDAE